MSNLTPEAQAQLADLAISLSNNPKTRKEFTKLVKEVSPNARFADVENDDLREEFNRKLEERDQQAKVDIARARLEAQRNGLIESGRFTEEQVKEIEKEVMEKEGIANYDTAAKLYAADRKPANSTHEIKSRTWQMPTLDKKAMNNLGQHTRESAYAVIDEIQRGKKRA